MSEIEISLTQVTLGEEEAAAAADVIRSGWMTMGPRVAAFESAFAEALDAPHAIAVANGTAALHLAYEACGLGADDEFIVPALTFVATLNAGLYLGARPVLVDCANADDLTMSPEDLARKITPRTRLIVPMAYGGFAPDMEAICRLADTHNIPIVEDACHAPLGRLDGRTLGTFGDAGTFSFFSNKNLAVGEGGMVVTHRADLAERVRLMRSHGMTAATWDRHRGRTSIYDVTATGFNYRMDEVHAAIGIEQLKKLPSANARRGVAAQGLRRRLRDLNIEGLGLPFGAPRGEPVHHLFVILLPPDASRALFRENMLARGVQTSIHYPPLHTLSAPGALWNDAPPHLPVLDALADRLVTLPMGPSLDDAQLDWVTESVAQALKNASS